ncbi:serpin family protein [Gordonia sp. CPCC 205515]|uniref:serpin family protein n=1 Tax=Gordonia sp. CPCC 205515 TaxID=3140791 RepID=UPI003AF33F81
MSHAESSQQSAANRVEPISPVARAANALTARWCSSLGGEDSALSAAGVWPLLALLASAADEPAGTELAAALGRPVDSAQRDALELVDILRMSTSATAALGIWASEGIPLYEAWTSGLPAGMVGRLTDQAALDRWAADETGGLIDHFPLDISEDTALLLASALAARVRWRDPFEGYPRHGGFGDSPPDKQWLRRTTSDLSAVAVLDDRVTRVVVEGEGDVDVHVMLGDRSPAEVLAVGLRELSGEARVQAATELDGGATGLDVRREKSTVPEDIVQLDIPSFEIRASHDLLAHRALFGLNSVTEADTHLPLLSPIPLFVSGGAQDVLARFFAEGFEAAAVTAFAVAAGAAPHRPEFDVTVVDVTFDRPFGFLAVHRPSRLAVVAGWVSCPFIL